MEESVSGLNRTFREIFDLQPVDLKTYSPLTLAYIGDAAYELGVGRGEMLRSISFISVPVVWLRQKPRQRRR